MWFIWGCCRCCCGCCVARIPTTSFYFCRPCFFIYYLIFFSPVFFLQSSKNSSKRWRCLQVCRLFAMLGSLLLYLLYLMTSSSFVCCYFMSRVCKKKTVQCFLWSFCYWPALLVPPNFHNCNHKHQCEARYIWQMTIAAAAKPHTRTNEYIRWLANSLAMTGAAINVVWWCYEIPMHIRICVLLQDNDDAAFAVQIWKGQRTEKIHIVREWLEFPWIFNSLIWNRYTVRNNINARTKEGWMGEEAEIPHTTISSPRPSYGIYTDSAHI